jgi:hypothetical protein
MHYGHAVRIAVFAALLAVYLLLPWVQWSPRGGFSHAAPAVVSGDEPHYLLIVNSLLHDRDLEVGADYQRALRGGMDAGVNFRGVLLDHHAIALDPRTGEHQLWQDMFDWRHPTPQRTFPRITTGLRNGYIELPAHPAAFPAMVAMFAWPFRDDPLLVERVGVELVALFTFLSLVAIYFAARAAELTQNEALAVSLIAGLASPLFPYARSFFAEPLTALLLSLALWAFLARRPALCGALCFAITAVKPAYGLVAFGWAALRAKQGRAREEALPLLAVYGAGCLALALFNWHLAHTPFIAGSSGFVPVKGLGNVGDLLFSDAHGLLSFAPWAIAALIVGARWPELGWAALPVLILMAVQDAGAGGYAYGPRYFVPFFPWLALATVRAVREASRGWRAAIIALCVCGALIAIPGALRYRDLFARPALDALRR